jgi:hypothetical protein
MRYCSAVFLHYCYYYYFPDSLWIDDALWARSFSGVTTKKEGTRSCGWRKWQPPGQSFFSSLLFNQLYNKENQEESKRKLEKGCVGEDYLKGGGILCVCAITR